MTTTLGELYEQGMEIVTVATTRNLNNSLNPAIKSTNFLNNILAKIESIRAGVIEAIMRGSSSTWAWRSSQTPITTSAASRLRRGSQISAEVAWRTSRPRGARI